MHVDVVVYRDNVTTTYFKIFFCQLLYIDPPFILSMNDQKHN